jgi:tape measure domain-containing protein
MSTDLETLLVRLEVATSGFEAGLNKADQRIVKHAKNVDVTMQRVDQRLEQTSQSFHRFSRNVSGALAGALGAREIIRASDNFITMENRLRSATKSAAEYEKVSRDLFSVAQSSRQPLKEVADLYFRLNGAFTDAQKQAFPIIDITERMGKAFLATGVEAQQAQAFILQLSQAAGADFKAVGQEINTLIESAPLLTKAIAEELGLKSASALKKFAEDGKLNVDNFFAAFQRATDGMVAQSDKMTVTVEQSLTRLDNAFLQYIGRQDLISTGTGALAAAINGLADNFEDVADVALLAAGVIGTRYVSALVLANRHLLVTTANTIALNVQMARMAGVGYAASSSLAILGRTAAGVFGGPLGLIAVGALTAYTFHTNKAEQAQQELHDTLQDLPNIAKELMSADKDIANAKSQSVNQQIQDITRLMVAEQELLNARLGIGEEFGLVGGALRDLGVAGREVAGKLGIGDAPSEMIDKIDAYQSRIKSLRDLLENPEKYDISTELTSTANAAGSGAGKIKKKADEAQRLLDKLKEATKQNQRTLEQETMLAEAAAVSADEYARVSRQIDIKNKLEQQGFKVGTELYELNEKILNQTDEKIKASKKLKDEEEDAARAAEEYAEAMRRPIENALEGIQDTISDTFVGVFDGSIDNAKDAADSIKRIFFRMAAEIATLELFGATGFGIDSLSGGQSGGSDGLSLDGFFNSGSLGQPLFQSGGTMAAGLDAVGSFFGLSGAEASGPMLDGSAGYMTGISTNFTAGAGLAGMGGGLAANMVGFDGGYSDVGSTAGSLIGTAVGGPIGAAIGAFAGTAIGSMLGTGRPHPASTFSVERTGGVLDFNTMTYRSKHLDDTIAQDLSTGVASAVQSLQSAGFDLAGAEIIAGGVDDGRGFFTTENYKEATENTIFFNPADQADAERALSEFIVALARESSNLTDILGNDVINSLENISTEGRAAAEILNDLDFIVNFQETFTAADRTFTDLELTVQDMAAQFDAAADTAERLGLSVDKVRQAEDERMSALLAGFTGNIGNEILQLTAPIEAQIQQERDRYARQLRDLAAVGAKQEDIQLAELLHKLNIEKINGEIASQDNDRVAAAKDLDRRFSAIQNTLGDFLFELTNGKYSPLTPTRNLDSIRDQVLDLGTRAGLGDIEAQEQLAELLPAFVQLSAEVNGFNAEFAKDRQIAEDLTRNTISVAQRQVSLQQSQIAAIERQTSSNVSGFAALEAAIARLGSNLSVDDVFNASTRGSRFGINVKLNQALAAATGFSGVFNPDPSIDEFDDFRVANPQFESVIEAVARSQGFANGGLVGGVSGIDKNLARLTKGEFVMNNAAVRAVGVDTMQSINTGGGVLINEIKGLRGDMQKLTEAVVVSGKMNNSELQALNHTSQRAATIERAIAYRG